MPSTQPKPRTIPQLKRSLVLAHAAYQRSLTDAGYMHQVRAKKRIRDAEEALAAAEQQAQAAQGHRLTSDQALARLAEPELEHNPSRCQCADPRCPVHAAAPCPHRAETVVRRVDMDDQTGTPMCEGCANDALDSGLFDVVEQAALADQEAEEAAFTVVFATRADLLHALGDPADPGTDEGLEALAHQIWAGADFDVAGGR